MRDVEPAVKAQDAGEGRVTFALPQLITGDRELDLAWRIALGDTAGNIVPFKDGLLEREAPVLLAGLEYEAPWTRDAAINVWNGAGLLCPTVARNTLLSVLSNGDAGVHIGGQYNQYWDAIIWAAGAWAYYLYTGDKPFLALAFTAVRNSMHELEQSEFAADLSLFRGPACYGDGVAAYPDVYANTGSSAILDWPAANPGLAAPAGYGLPMHTLSTNCLYFQAYTLLGEMERELVAPVDPDWRRKAEALREAIQHRFWNAKEGHFRYLVDPFGGCEHQEGLGVCFALLFGLATGDQAQAALRDQHITPAGIPCVWPTFERYTRLEGGHFGRHSGTVWPHIQGFWAEVTARYGEERAFAFELRQMAHKAVRDGHFAELYHPLTGEIYGGAQEWQGWIATDVWRGLMRQTWSATAYVRAVLLGLFGMRFTPDGVSFAPMLPQGVERVVLRGLLYRDASLDIVLRGAGRRVVQRIIDGAPDERTVCPATLRGTHHIELLLGD